MINRILNRWSKNTKIIRVVAYILRWRYKKANKSYPISVDEMQQAEDTIIKMIQKEHFSGEYECLNTNQQLQKKSPLKSLGPFLDEQKVMRVRGRLENSMMMYEQKHPAILPHASRFTSLVIENAHLKLFHCGEQSTLRHIREK